MEKLPNGYIDVCWMKQLLKSGKVLFNSNGAQVPASGGFDIKSYALYDQNGYCETIVPSDKIVTKLDVKFNTDVIETAKVGKKVKLTAQANGGSGIIRINSFSLIIKVIGTRLRIIQRDNTNYMDSGSCGRQNIICGCKR